MAGAQQQEKEGGNAQFSVRDEKRKNISYLGRETGAISCTLLCACDKMERLDSVRGSFGVKLVISAGYIHLSGTFTSMDMRAGFTGLLSKTEGRHTQPRNRPS